MRADASRGARHAQRGLQALGVARRSAWGCGPWPGSWRRARSCRCSSGPSPPRGACAPRRRGPCPRRCRGVSGVRPRTYRARTVVRRSSRGRPSTPRPTMFVSMPAPLTFLPISSRTSTSISGKGSDGIHSRAWRSSSGSPASNSGPGEHLHPRQVVVGVLDEGHPEEEGQPADHDARGLADHRLVAVARGRLVALEGALDLAEADRAHLQQAAAQGRAREVGVGLHAVDEHDRVGLQGVPGGEHPEAQSGAAPAPRSRRSTRWARPRCASVIAEGLEHVRPGRAQCRRRGSPWPASRRARAPAAFRVSTTAATTSA